MGRRSARGKPEPRIAKLDDFSDFPRRDPSMFDSTDMIHLGSMQFNPNRNREWRNGERRNGERGRERRREKPRKNCESRGWIGNVLVWAVRLLPFSTSQLLDFSTSRPVDWSTGQGRPIRAQTSPEGFQMGSECRYDTIGMGRIGERKRIGVG
jgi:hypothetical protein